MCAIAGLAWRYEPGPVDRPAFAMLVRSMAHRGPDAEGVCHRERFTFGHRRLSVIDLNARANQPMVDGSGRLYLTFNGEIYNHRALRAELQRLGSEFRTDSDSEVILAGYERWGKQVVHRLDGMFAFGLFDETSNELLLVRDRLGIKPVFYFVSDRAVYFASELKGVIGHREVPRKLDPHAVSSFLSYRHCLGDRTYFEGVRSLEPGTLLQLKRGAVSIERYWQVDTARVSRPAPSVQRIEQLLAGAVARQSVADVPMAAFLSGGLDSSILLYEMSRQGIDGLRCITAKSENPAYDEARYARDVAARLGVPWLGADMAVDDLFSSARDQIRIKDQPLGMHNEVAMRMLAGQIRPYACVVMCGEGADELFCGYGRIFRAPFDHARMRWAGRMPAAIGAPMAAGVGIGPAEFGLNELDFFLGRYQYFPKAEKFALYTPEFAASVQQDVYTYERLTSLFQQHRHLDFDDRIWLFFVQHHLPGLLGMVDACTMAVGLEARVPFTDHALVQAAFDLPSTDKLAWRSPLQHLKAWTRRVDAFSERCDETKSVLRRAYAGKLPPAVIDRRKMGFPVPLGHWLSAGQLPKVRSLLLTPGTRLHAVADPQALSAWLARGLQNADDVFGRKVWLLCNLAIFLEEYF